jgi:hypothetical protein
MNLGVNDDVLSIVAEVHSSESFTSDITTVADCILVGGIPQSKGGLQLGNSGLLDTTS